MKQYKVFFKYSIGEENFYSYFAEHARDFIKNLLERDFVHAYNYYADKTDYEMWNEEAIKAGITDGMDDPKYMDFIGNKQKMITRRMNMIRVSLFWVLDIGEDLQLIGEIDDDFVDRLGIPELKGATIEIYLKEMKES